MTLKIQPTDPPDCPEHLTGDAQVMWLALVPQLLDNDTLPPAVGANLEIACQAYADWRTHTARVAEQGSLVKSPNGFAVQHPSVAIANKAAAIWLRFEKQLGLNKPRKTKPSESKLTALLNTTPTRKAAQ